jgi:hypothetical protein
MVSGLYDILEDLVLAQYSNTKLEKLKPLNGKLDLLRFQTRLLLDFELIKEERYEYAAKLIDAVGVELGGWIKQQQKREVG